MEEVSVRFEAQTKYEKLKEDSLNPTDMEIELPKSTQLEEEEGEEE